MLSEPRTISLLCDLVHLPLEHSSERLREVYNRVCVSCGYENFIRTPTGARIERKPVPAGGSSQLVFQGDRIQLIEDHSGTTVDQFGEKVKAVLADTTAVLGIPVILIQQITVRVISTPNGFRSASEFLSQKIFRIEPADLEGFGRPTGIFGFRLVSPASQSDPNSFNVRVESYTRDPRSIYVENVASFKKPVQPAAFDSIAGNIRSTSEFVVEKVIPFLSAYDRRDNDS